MDNPDTPVDGSDRPAPRLRPTQHRYLERLTAFSDGVVAIALTLLVLPLVDIAAPHEGESAWQVLSDNGGPLAAFALSFVVIATLWMAHSEVFEAIGANDGVIVWTNMLYLFTIVLLPFPTRWLQDADQTWGDGIGTLYLLTLAVASSSLYVISRHSRRHPELLTEQARAEPARFQRGASPFFAIYFLVGAGLVVLVPQFGTIYMIALWPASALHGRWQGRRRSDESPATA